MRNFWKISMKHLNFGLRQKCFLVSSHFACSAIGRMAIFSKSVLDFSKATPFAMVNRWAPLVIYMYCMSIALRTQYMHIWHLQQINFYGPVVVVVCYRSVCSCATSNDIEQWDHGATNKKRNKIWSATIISISTSNKINNTNIGNSNSMSRKFWTKNVHAVLSFHLCQAQFTI